MTRYGQWFLIFESEMDVISLHMLNLIKVTAKNKWRVAANASSMIFDLWSLRYSLPSLVSFSPSRPSDLPFSSSGWSTITIRSERRRRMRRKRYGSTTVPMYQRTVVLIEHYWLNISKIWARIPTETVKPFNAHFPCVKIVIERPTFEYQWIVISLTEGWSVKHIFFRILKKQTFSVKCPPAMLIIHRSNPSLLPPPLLPRPTFSPPSLASSRELDGPPQTRTLSREASGMRRWEFWYDYNFHKNESICAAFRTWFNEKHGESA